MSKLEGLLTCEDCGALVEADSATTHLNWHEDLDTKTWTGRNIIDAVVYELRKRGLANPTRLRR